MVTIREILEARHEIALEGPTNLEQLEKTIRLRNKKPPEPKQTRPEVRKDYMSRVEREEFMLLAAMASKLEEIIVTWVNHGRPRERIKWAKTSLAFIYKAMEDCIKGIPLDTVAQIVREVGLCTIGIVEYKPKRR